MASDEESTGDSAEPSEDLCYADAVQLAALIRNKELSVGEVMEAHLKRIHQVNQQVNAICTLVPEDELLAQARKADDRACKNEFMGPLFGLPIAIKDLAETQGIRTTYGSRLYTDNVPSFDGLIVERLKAAGAIVIGKTNTPESGAGSHTFNEIFGVTRNPYNLGKTAGGSSGGAAAALQ